MKEFDVEPPEVMIGVYPAGSMPECFVALCQVLVDLGCKPGKETARGVEYGYPDTAGAPVPWLIVGVHAHGFMMSGARGTRTERRAAEQLGPWTREVLRLCVSQCQVYFGTVGFECSLLTSTELGGGWNGVPSSIFVSDRVLTGHPQVRLAFATDCRRGEVQESVGGRVFSSGPNCGAEWVGGSDRTSNLLGRAVHTMTLKAAMAQDQREAYG